MDQQNQLFAVALGLSAPWKVTKSALTKGNSERMALELDIGFESGAKFPCPECGVHCGVHDTMVRRWRHLQFWQHETVIHCRVPRTACKEHGPLQVPVPWARPGSGFTLLFEAFVMALAKEMTVSAIGELVGEHDTRLWRIIHHYVDEAHDRQDWSEVETVGFDDTATRKGHKYATVAVDIDSQGEKPARLLFMCPIRTAESIGDFVAEMPAHGAVPEQIKKVAIDMSRAYQKGAAEHLPLAEIAFDRFHVMKKAGEALDAVRKQLRKQGHDMTGALWSLRGNASNLTAENLTRREELCLEYKEIARALALKEMLSETWEYTMRFLAEEHLEAWCSWASRSRLEPFKDLCKTIKSHWEGILGFFPDRVTSAAIEAINGVIQTARRRARGFRNFRNLQAIAYWIAGDLDLKVPAYP
jgi:transposase